MADEQINTQFRKQKNNQNLNEKSSILKSAFSIHNRHLSTSSIKEAINSKPEPENFENFKEIIGELDFEIVEHNFERKIQATEFPHSLYIANYSTAAATCLTLRKWLFHPRVEAELIADQVALSILFHGAVEDVNRGAVVTKDRLHQLKSLQDSSRMADYLACVREMSGYGGIMFPHCASDARKEGHVVPIISSDAFR